MMLRDGTAASGVIAVVWRPPYPIDVLRGRKTWRGGSVRAASVKTRERGGGEAQARRGWGALGLRGTGTDKEELPEQ